MKTLLFLLLLISVNSFGQIQPIDEKDKMKSETVGEVKRLGLFYASCSRFITPEKDTSYGIYFNNIEYQHITDIKYFTFDETGGDFDRLYNIVETALLAKEKKEVEIPLKKGKLTLVFAGKSMQMVWYSSGVFSRSMYLTLPQYQKLFGKVDPHAANRED